MNKNKRFKKETETIEKNKTNPGADGNITELKNSIESINRLVHAKKAAANSNIVHLKLAS